MDSRYIYASTVAYTLHQKLPSETQRELLFSARDKEEFYKALQDTFVAPQLSLGQEEHLTHILDQVVRDAKETLVKIAPEPDILEIFWMKYDFQNLKTLIAWSNVNLDQSKLEESWVHLGNYALPQFLQSFQEGKLGALNPRLHQALKESATQKNEIMKDMVLDANYLRSIRDMAQTTENKFIQEFVRIRIDLFNILSRLRILATPENESVAKDFFIRGGTYTLRDLETEENIFRVLLHFGGKQLWNAAFGEYNDKKQLFPINKVADEYILGWLKKQSIELYSPAPLVSYFMAVKNSVQMIRTVAVSKELGISEQKMRSMVRKSYQSHAF